MVITVVGLVCAAYVGYRYRQDDLIARLRDDVRTMQVPTLALPSALNKAPAWMIYATTDPQSGATLRNARLLAMPASDSGAANDASAQNILELHRESNGSDHASLILNPGEAANCGAISSISARFDNQPAQNFPVTSSMRPSGCTLEFTGFDQFLQPLRAASVLVLAVNTDASAIKFIVSGLVWGQEE